MRRPAVGEARTERDICDVSTDETKPRQEVTNKQPIAGKEGVMALSMWTDNMTGRRLEGAELTELRNRAHRLYEANTHIFEDEWDALMALGAVPVVRAA